MAGKPCIDQIALPQKMKDYIISQREVHAKNGLNEKEADLLSAKELREKSLDQLHNVYQQSGIEGYDNRITDTAKKPVQEKTTTAEKLASEKPVSESTKPTGQSDAKAADAIPPVKEPPIDNGTDINSVNEGGITHAANEVRREEQNLNEYEKNPETFEKWTAEAEQKIKDGYDVEALFDKMQNINYDPTPVENQIRKIYIATLDAEIAKNPTDELLSKQRRFIEIGDLANSRAGKNLVSLRGEVSPLSTISDFYVAKMESLDVDKLTDNQKQEIKKQFDEIEKRAKDAESKMAMYQAKISDYKAAEELRKIEDETKKSKNTPAKRSAVKTDKDFKAERQSLKDKLAKQFSQYKESTQKLGITSDGGAESFVITAKMAKTIGEIVKSHVEEIGANLKEVVNRVFEEIKDVFPAITENDIRDVISGKYNEPQKTKSQLQLDLKDIQDEQKLIDKLEQLQNGNEPKLEKDKIKRNQQITDLRKQISDYKKLETEANKFYSDETLKDAAKLKSIKNANEKKEKEIRDKITSNDFEPETKSAFLEDDTLKKRFPKEYKEAFDAINARESARHDFEVALLKDERSKRGFGKKYVFDPIKDVIGTAKALRAGIDFSAIFIQNIVPIVSHPVTGAKSIIHSFGDFWSQKKFERDLASLHESPYWSLIKKSGLDVTEPKSFSEKNKEETFNRNLLEKDITIKGKKYNIGKYTTAPFERQFTSLGNHIRVSSFLRIAAKLEQEGKTFESHPKLFKDAAELFNTQTGRGSLPDFIQKSTETVNSVIWSPRLMASRLNLLGLSDIGFAVAGKKGFYGKLSPEIRKRAALDFVKFAGAIVGIYASASYFLGAQADLDPLSPTFGDIKADGKSDKSYNMFGGFSQYVKLAAILAMGERETGTHKKMEDITDPKGKSRADLALKFMRGKLTPLASATATFLDNKDYLGRPVDKKQEILNLIEPLSLSGIPDDINRDGWLPALTNGLISATGINVKDNRDYQKPKKK